jgi:hypothetical protein
VNHKYGLIGNVRYIDPKDEALFRSTDAFLERGTKVPYKVYLKDVFVPTVAWTEGFKMANGTKVYVERNGTQDALYEYFSIHAKSNLVLTQAEEAGYYQLALLADDGASLDVLEPGKSTYTRMMDLGWGPEKLGCSYKAIYLAKGQKLPIKVGYFQGPREHISLSLLWRKVDREDAPLDKDCGNFPGIEYYFNSTVRPTQQKEPFLQLLERKWKPVAHENFLLHSGSDGTCKVK